jgi:hypothetical protein
MRVRARGSSGAVGQDGVLGATAGAWRLMDRLLRCSGAWVQEVVVVVLYSRSFFRASFFFSSSRRVARGREVTALFEVFET